MRRRVKLDHGKLVAMGNDEGNTFDRILMISVTLYCGLTLNMSNHKTLFNELVRSLLLG